MIKSLLYSPLIRHCGFRPWPLSQLLSHSSLSLVARAPLSLEPCTFFCLPPKIEASRAGKLIVKFLFLSHDSQKGQVTSLCSQRRLYGNICHYSHLKSAFCNFNLHTLYILKEVRLMLDRLISPKIAQQLPIFPLWRLIPEGLTLSLHIPLISLETPYKFSMYEYMTRLIPIPHVCKLFMHEKRDWKKRLIY